MSYSHFRTLYSLLLEIITFLTPLLPFGNYVCVKEKPELKTSKKQYYYGFILKPKSIVINLSFRMTRVE